jgi:hypothetical protein
MKLFHFNTARVERKNQKPEKITNETCQQRNICYKNGAMMGWSQSSQTKHLYIIIIIRMWFAGESIDFLLSVVCVLIS